MSPGSFVYILFIFFCALWFRKSNKRWLKLLACALVSVTVILALTFGDCYSCRSAPAIRFAMTYIQGIIIFYFWAYLFYFIMFLVRVARKQDKFPTIKISTIKAGLWSCGNKLKDWAIKAKYLFVKLGLTNILLITIATMLLFIIAKMYRWRW